ncbi:putative U3 small nucleolar ribonucleoprotein Lcp5 [Drepanopeziza brunnea f. sp. 'multigermtubi' MB_m1]|uniref:Putative U3 small nucleolar ribonucleoprotein Lcp5 n=1 Tax=Marssonina brunnea f. sp. multigermtubi (strain MB_m1) TaxID=1072389 RepID=K1WYV2_MARBU|nr:putative U3 small nucleolar ribonucleoprotein Lcp5 [Drepanopeziza brunnea f. sp. 'multigermtubi' MB_m1]EKD17792.1 putative U3 small nucleolar ribonucleoprotein Lcp5 [Drepanopeziza brunnea f. sp. 'multigermtubi' MB_m1]
MATKSTFVALLDTLQQALSSASESSQNLKAPIPPKDGISLLDVKNELFLSYLQNLAFLILLKLRNRRSGSDDDDDGEYLSNSVTKKLVELQVYLEKGVRPLESKLKYQIDKVLRAADDAKRTDEMAATQKHSKPAHDNDDSEKDSDAESSDGVALNSGEIDDLQYRPNPTSFVRPAAVEANYKRNSHDGVYKPPRIQATAMPTTSAPREKEAKKPNKSATLDEFVSTELSAAPMAEPSIGSTIVSGGRRSKSEKEKMDERERKEYEERNYVRLPKESKKDRAKKPRKDAGYGGEEWRGLGEGIDRIERLTTRKSGAGGAVEKSRKRPATDGTKSSGEGVGQHLQKKMKILDNVRRDRGRR